MSYNQTFLIRKPKFFFNLGVTKPGFIVIPT